MQTLGDLCKNMKTELNYSLTAREKLLSKGYTCHFQMMMDMKMHLIKVIGFSGLMNCFSGFLCMNAQPQISCKQICLLSSYTNKK